MLYFLIDVLHQQFKVIMQKLNINLGIINYQENVRSADCIGCDIVMRRDKNGHCNEVVRNIHGKTGIIRNQKDGFKLSLGFLKLRIRFSMSYEK